MWYDGSQLNPSVFSYTNLPQKGRNLALGHTWVMSTGLVNETRFGYNYAYHLNSPVSLDGRNWVGDIGLRNLAGGTDPIDYGRPGFTITGFTGNGEGGITQGATENIFSISNATSWVKGRHNVRFGIQAQYRKFEHLTEVPPRGGFTFNGHVQRQSDRRLPARLLLDLHWRIRQLALELHLADDFAVHRRCVAGVVAVDTADWACGGNTSRRGTNVTISKACSIRRPARLRITSCRRTCRRRWCRSSTRKITPCPLASSRRTSTTGVRASGRSTT